MDLQLHGQRAFISGSTQGIGYAIAEELVKEGVHVILNGRTEKRSHEAAQRLREAVPAAEVGAIAADFSDPAQVSELAASLGRIDILVNNVGVFDLVEFTSADDAVWDHYLQVDLMSAVRLSRALLPGMLARGEGRILSIASESGVNIPANMIPYGVAKAGMIALGNGLAKLTRGTKVTVNTILGGPTYSDGVAGVISGIARAQDIDPADVKRGIEAGNAASLLERFLDSSEIAHLAAYLASPLASGTNGAAIRAEGGVLTTML